MSSNKTKTGTPVAYCPYMLHISYTHTLYNGEPVRSGASTQFGTCIRESCMAWKNNDCRRFNDKTQYTSDQL